MTNDTNDLDPDFACDETHDTNPFDFGDEDEARINEIADEADDE